MKHLAAVIISQHFEIAFALRTEARAGLLRNEYWETALAGAVLDFPTSLVVDADPGIPALVSFNAHMNRAEFERLLNRFFESLLRRDDPLPGKKHVFLAIHAAAAGANALTVRLIRGGHGRVYPHDGFHHVRQFCPFDALEFNVLPIAADTFNLMLSLLQEGGQAPGIDVILADFQILAL